MELFPERTPRTKDPACRWEALCKRWPASRSSCVKYFATLSQRAGETASLASGERMTDQQGVWTGVMRSATRGAAFLSERVKRVRPQSQKRSQAESFLFSPHQSMFEQAECRKHFFPMCVRLLCVCASVVKVTGVSLSLGGLSCALACFLKHQRQKRLFGHWQEDGAGDCTGGWCSSLLHDATATTQLSAWPWLTANRSLSLSFLKRGETIAFHQEKINFHHSEDNSYI